MTDSRTVRVGLVQKRVGPDPAANLAHTIAGIREAAAKGAQVICTQELFGWYYFCQREDHEFFKLAEALPAVGLVGACYAGLLACRSAAAGHRAAQVGSGLGAVALLDQPHSCGA